MPSGGDYREREAKALDTEIQRSFQVGSHTSIFAIPPHLATPTLSVSGGLGSYRTYGTIGSGVSTPTMEQATALWHQQQETHANIPDGEVPPILVKEVEQDGKIVLTVEGQSTLPQTVFNSIK
jgi:vesicular inhibitory amino acid transporter